VVGQTGDPLLLLLLMPPELDPLPLVLPPELDPLPLVLPPELDPLLLVLPPELEPLVLPLDPPPLLLLLPLDPPPLPLPLAPPELDPPPSPGPAVKVAPPQATTAREVERAAKTPRRQERRGSFVRIVARDRARSVPRATFGNWLILRRERRALMCQSLALVDRNDTAILRLSIAILGLSIAILRLKIANPPSESPDSPTRNRDPRPEPLVSPERVTRFATRGAVYEPRSDARTRGELRRASRAQCTTSRPEPA
jgi:hypothetical protein